MKEIYFVLTHTGTVLSRIVKMYTKDEFSHISISLDKNLNEMYSFGRKRPYNPLDGGLVHEHIDSGTFKRFYKTKCRVYCLEITDKQYDKISKKVYEMYKKKDIYKFNIIGLFEVSVNKKHTKKDHYYCAEFVKYLLEQADVKNDLPYIVKPEDFKNINGMNEIYHGYLRDYKV